MRGRIFRHVSMIASLVLFVAVPAQASPIRFADVVSVMGDLQRGGHTEQLRLRATQDPIAPRSARTTSSQANDATFPPATAGDVAASNDLVATENLNNTSLTAGTDIAPQQPQGQVTVFDQDQVNGTICDCGEIPTVGGGFPKWPFLLLIPLVCVTGICTQDDPDCPECVVPTPTPTPPVPEPTSLLLLGSGIAALSAGARRRYAKMRAAKEAETMFEV